MASITINEISQNYTYAIGTNSYATVAMPITSCWGPGYFDASSIGNTTDEQIKENTKWIRYPSTQAGLEAFVATYRGPATNYKGTKDNSYFMALTLMSAGYDVLVCRVSPGMCATTSVGASGTSLKVGTNATTPKADIVTKAKYPGTFGNNIYVTLTRIPTTGTSASTSPQAYWSLVVYVVATSGTKTAVENLRFVFESAHATDAVPHISEIESKFINISVDTSTEGYAYPTDSYVVITDNAAATLSGGTDTATYDSGVKAINESATGKTKGAMGLVAQRYGTTTSNPYYTKISSFVSSSALSGISDQQAYDIAFREWTYTAACEVYSLLTDKLNYNPNRIASPGWDDQDFRYLNGDQNVDLDSVNVVSPMHVAMLSAAYSGRCATAMLDAPRSLYRDCVQGYANMVSSYAAVSLSTTGVDTILYPSHAALFAPWCQYKYVGTSKMSIASPSFAAMMIQRAMILNQAAQYEWALPTNRKQNIEFGKYDYMIPDSIRSTWQGKDGVGINIITNLPDLGTTLWGNSTLFNVPPATYNALQNLSTRFLMNAVEDVVYRCGVAITYQYNNGDAYSAFYAGVTPLLDTMKNVGAIDDYRVEMSAEVDANDQIMANSVIGKIYLVVNGVINDITVDLIALPPGTNLNQLV